MIFPSPEYDDFHALSLVSPQATEAFKFADATKALVMELVFTGNRDLRAERRELSGYTINYVSWLADVLLHCEQAEQAGLIDAFFQYADLTRNDNSGYLLTELPPDTGYQREKQILSGMYGNY